MKRTRDIGRCLCRAFDEWREDRAGRLSAALSFYTLFSLAPLLVFFVLAAGLALGREGGQAFITSRLREFLGPQAADVIGSLIENARNREPVSGLAAGAAGIAAMLWGGSTVFGCLADSLNAIWNVKRRGGRFGIRGFLVHRLAASVMVFGTGAFLVVSSLATLGLAALGAFLSERLTIPVQAFRAGDFLLSVAVLTLLFSAVFKWVPLVRQTWSDVWPAGLLTAFLFSVGKYGIGLYLVTSSVSSAYGAAGSLVVMLIGVYLAAEIFYYGAEFNKVWMRTRGSGAAQK
ncbi:MAG: YihY/virulence factor BrkB family protein [bacterium]|nr:YihY/virulence factor BrkB family protein [bacterium]